MKKSKSVLWFSLVVVFLGSAFVAYGEDKQLEKRRKAAVEGLVKSNRKSDGDYSTISLKNCRDEIGPPFLSNEDIIRRVLDTFDTYYKNLEVIDYLIVYTNKPGPNGGIECDFLIIHHKTIPERNNRFAIKEK